MAGPRYHSSNPCWENVRWSPGPSKISTLVLEGANGVLLKPKAPFRKASDDMWGFNLAGRRMLRVSTDCRMRRHHKCKEKLGRSLITHQSNGV